MPFARWARWLADHLDRLRHTLDLLRGQLREAVARSVGRAVADAVTEAVQALLSDRPGLPTRSGAPAWSRPRTLWGEPDRPPWDRDEEDLDERARPEADDDEDFRPEPPVSPAEQQQLSLHQALALAFQAAACWLRRHRGRFPVLGAVLVGLAAGLAAVARGRLLAASVDVALALLDLLGWPTSPA